MLNTIKNINRKVKSRFLSGQKKLLSVLILFMLSQMPFKTFAQCDPAIPNGANVVSSTQTVNGGFTPEWVCSGDTLFSDGGIFLVYLEGGAVMSTGGGIDSIYVKDGATLIMNGGIHVILHEPSAILNVAGGSATYYPCPSITFDYSNAPASGCLMTSAPEENINSISFSVSPNPATNELAISNLQFAMESVEIYDMVGERCFAPPLNPLKGTWASIDVSKLSPGIYFVMVLDEKGNRATRKFVKM
jgi:hypothetical protein